MFGSQILDIAIGIFFVYLLLSLICSALNELISRIFSMRAKNLEQGIRNLLNDPEFAGYAKDFYNHPLIKSLERKGKRPSYIPSRTFALVLMDVVGSAESALSSERFNSFRSTVAKIDNNNLKKMLLVYIDVAENNLNKFVKNIEEWFDDAMQRVSGWYKRKAQLIILFLALAICAFFNADSLMIANSLSHDAVMRNAVALAAAEYIKQPPPAKPEEKPGEESLGAEEKVLTMRIKQLREQIQKLQLPLGWTKVSGDPRGVPGNFPSWLAKILGILFTTIAVSLGAPFWFDVLNKFVNLRSAGGRPGKENKKADSSSAKG
jgi:hypothetical protein